MLVPALPLPRPSSLLPRRDGAFLPRKEKKRSLAAVMVTAISCGTAARSRNGWGRHSEVERESVIVRKVLNTLLYLDLDEERSRS
jgi:hypothetical protein